jgi:hypothetical protein
MTNDKTTYEPIAKLYRDCPPPGICGVYSLIDPVSGETKYVGQSKDIARRYKSHLRTSNRDRSKRGRWVSKLIDEDLAPLVVVLSECGNTWELDSAEQHWQLHYANLGANLVNEKLNRKPQIVSRRIVEYGSVINSPFKRSEPERAFQPVKDEFKLLFTVEDEDQDAIDDWEAECKQREYYREMIKRSTALNGKHKGKCHCYTCNDWYEPGYMEINVHDHLQCNDCYDPEEGHHDSK